MQFLCPDCETKVDDSERFCPRCGISIDPETAQPAPELAEGQLEYREPTMQLRTTIFMVYFGLFMTLAAAAVFFIFIFPSIFISVPLIILEIYIARNLGRYNNRARFALVVLASVIVGIAIYLFYDSQAITLVSGTITFLALFSLYTLILHQDSIELYSGKYQRDPDYSLFGYYKDKNKEDDEEENLAKRY